MGRRRCRQRRRRNYVLAPDSVTFGVIVEVADAGDIVPGFLGNRVVEDNVAIL